MGFSKYLWYGNSGLKKMKNFIIALSLSFCLCSASLADFFERGWDDYSSSSSFGRGKIGAQPTVSIDLDPENVLNSSLRMAAREDRLADLKRLLVEGADVNTQAPSGETALMYAARNC